MLKEEDYALEARQRLAEVDAELRRIGYDPGEHERIRQAEQVERSAEDEMRTLEKHRQPWRRSNVKLPSWSARWRPAC